MKNVYKVIIVLLFPCMSYPLYSQSIQDIKCVGGSANDGKSSSSYLCKDSSILSFVLGNSTDFDFSLNSKKYAGLIIKHDKAGNEVFKYLIQDYFRINDLYLNYEYDTILNSYEFVYTASRDSLGYLITDFKLRLGSAGNLLSLDSTRNVYNDSILNNIYYLYNTSYYNTILLHGIYAKYKNRFFNQNNGIDFLNSDNDILRSFYSENPYVYYMGIQVRNKYSILAYDPNSNGNPGVKRIRVFNNKNNVYTSKVVDSIRYDTYASFNYRNAFYKLNGNKYLFSILTTKMDTTQTHYKYYIIDTLFNTKIIDCKNENFDSIPRWECIDNCPYSLPITKSGKFIIYNKKINGNALVKCFDVNANRIWSLEINHPSCFDYVSLLENNYLYLSYVNRIGNSINRGICKIDTSGNLIYEYLIENKITYNSIPYNIKVFAYGNNVLLNYNYFDSIRNTYYYKFDYINENGIRQWSKEFYLDSILFIDFDKPLYNKIDNSITIVYNHKYNGNYDVQVLKLNASTGYVVWSKRFNGNKNDFGSMPLPLSKQQVFIDGYTNSTDNNFVTNHSSNNDYFYCILNPAYNIIKGKVFIDYNNNLTYESSNEFLYNEGIISSIKNANIAEFSAPYNGSFINQLDTGSYTSTFSAYNNYFTATPISKITSHTNYGNTDTIDFALHPRASINDLRLTLVNTWITRPGFANTYEAVYTNEGTTVMNNASVAVILDNRLTYNNAVPMPTSIVGDTLKWNLAAINPSQQGKIKINFTGKTPPTLNDRDSLLSKAIIYPITNDSTPNDNKYTLSDIARSSYDPNDKNVESNAMFTPSQISNGDYITYRIRFQNTGSYIATNIFVLDTLDANLDWSSLQLIATSHSGLQTVIHNNNIIEFKFYNINLPAATSNEVLSHGYIVFKIKPKSNLVAGNLVKNTAHITFDFNTPVNTTTALVRVISVTGTINKYNIEGEMRLYPNPNNGDFIVEFISKGNYPIKISLIDILGKVVFTSNSIHNDKSEIQVKDNLLPSGEYLLQISSQDNVWNKKVIIQR